MTTTPSDQRKPSFDGVRRAAERIAAAPGPHATQALPRPRPTCSATEVWVKHENHQPTGAFKVRGGVNLVSQLSEEERRSGLIAASTGNHGQSVAYAARLFGVEATICVPEGANPVKVRSMEDLGARIIPFGRDFDDAREHCESLAGGEWLIDTCTRATRST